MATTNVLIAGVGGQGLVLATKIVSAVAFREGFDVKSSDIIGLSQRGGMVWGSIRFSEDEVSSPLIPHKQADYLVAMESLEGLRWVDRLKPGATVILNEVRVFPNRVLLEKEEYPTDVSGQLKQRGFVVEVVDSLALAKEVGNVKLANTVLLGYLSLHLPFSLVTWVEVLKRSVPPKTMEQNVEAFLKARHV